MVAGLSSSKGVLSLLRESDPDVLQFALKRLRTLVDTFWYEISTDLSLIEELNESSDLAEETRQTAALIASHVYFHLGAYNESVNYALAAGPAFNYVERSLFTDTILSRCIDQFVLSQEQPEETRGKLDPRLESLFTALTNKWILQEDTPVKELVGFTIRARRLDFLEKVLRQHITSTGSAAILNFTFGAVSLPLRDIGFKRKVLGLLAELYALDGLSTMDYFSQAQCLLLLGDSARTASMIETLIVKGDKATAFQLAFDMCEYGNQEFLAAVSSALEKKIAPFVQLSATKQDGGGENAANEEEPAPQPQEVQEDEKSTVAVYRKLLAVLSGETSASLYLKFLHAQCNADIHVLNRIKNFIDVRKKAAHNATVIAHALMYSGTTIDTFLHSDIDWLSNANYWAKFVATASIGVVHYGNIEQSHNVMSAHLPKESIGPLPYSEAGALYGLGLIHAPVGVACNRKVVEYLETTLRSYSTSEHIIHGGSLGMGLAAMGLKNENLRDLLFTCVSGCDAVASEGAAVGIGLLMMGSGDVRFIREMVTLASEDNQKEKTIRGISMALALMMLGREDDCLVLEKELLEHPDPWVRLGGCFMLGLAYAGVENNKVLERLLSMAVKDTSDDVRRNAVTMIGFLTIKDPRLCVELTRVLVDSYNPHIRYGVGMALAISAAGTGRSDVIEILWTLKDDLVDFVRQGAYIALALVMVQMTEAENPKVKELRDIFTKKISGRKEDMCSRFGCIIASGILDAGGRNCTFALHRQRHRLDKAVVGMFIFLQYWYWFPYLLMITLAMRPTCFIGLNDNLEMPEYSFMSNAPPSRFALPKSVPIEKKEAKAAALKAVVLSTTKKEEEFVRLKRSAANSKVLDGDAAPSAAGGSALSQTSAAAGTAANKPDEEKEGKKEAEPSFVVLTNPSRVTARQFAVVTHDMNNRFVPIKSDNSCICLLRDTKPEEGQHKILKDMGNTNSDDAPPPEPFTWP